MNKVGVVTGAGRGIGRACIAEVAALVDTVILVDRDEAGLKEAADSVDRDVLVFTADVTDAHRMGELAEAISGAGSFRALAHAAGVSPTMASWRDVMGVDLVASAHILKLLRPLVVDGSAAVCFASMASQLMIPTADPVLDPIIDDCLAGDFLDAISAAAGEAMEDPAVAYGWAKRGVQRLARREALAWGDGGGRVCSISPGLVDTPQGRQEAASQPAMATLLEMAPIKRYATADELAAVTGFLLSDAASFVTGTDLLVDGGCVAALELA